MNTDWRQIYHLFNPNKDELISPLWTEHHKTARCKDSHYFSWPRPSPSAAASVPSHQLLIEFSAKQTQHTLRSETCSEHEVFNLHQHEQVNHLHRHDLVTRLVHHLIDGAVSPSADLAQIFEILGREVPVLLRGDLQLSWWLDTVCSQPLSAKNHKCVLRDTEKVNIWMLKPRICFAGLTSCQLKGRRFTHMCGFWKGGPAVFSVNLVVGLIGGLAKFSFRALRLPEQEKKQ